MKRTRVIHPFFFAFYSVLGIYSQNATQVPLEWMWRSLLIVSLIAVVVYWLLKAKFDDAEYAGWATTLFIIWLFSGHVYLYLLSQTSFWRSPFGGTLAALLFTSAFLLFASRWLWGKITNRKTITTFLNVVSAALVLFSAWAIGSTLFRSSSQIQTIKDRLRDIPSPMMNGDGVSPDIYFIILDGYGREDTLRALYGFDNSDFASFLRDSGFYVVDRSTPNYPQTELSISSSMNLNYLDSFVDGFGETSDRGPLRELLQHSVLRRILEQRGYTFVALPSAALFAQMTDADVYYNAVSGGVNEFEGLVLSSTVVGVLAESWGMELPVQGYSLHKRYILSAFEALQTVPELPSPKFVFAHILSPHPPFVFDRDGNFVPPTRPYSTWDASLYTGSLDEYKKGYIDQLVFVNAEMKRVIASILEKSATPPIIIVMGDHGPGAYYDMLDLDESCLTERFSILNAFYFPDGNYDLLYPSITPVNSFRVVLDQYFGADMDLLEDKNYFAGWLSPYQFTNVSDKIDAACILPK
ncbi:MAG: hypothetical protein IT314_17565 [Anaerolineales bacterium]|nr:hypothetical protein [Anaerolineales bacterium]